MDDTTTAAPTAAPESAPEPSAAPQRAEGQPRERGPRRGPGGGNRRGGHRGPRNDRSDEFKGDFIEKTVHVNRCAKVGKGGRNFSFSSLVVTGDGKGRIG